MAGIVLVIDDKDRLSEVVQEALDGLDAKLELVTAIPAAKRFVVSKQPGVVISNVLLGENEVAGFDFCREMRDHTLFADLPVILVGESLTEEVIRDATESGAPGLVGWPVAASTLRKRLVHFLEEQQTSSGSFEVEVEVSLPTQTAKPAAAPPKPAAPAMPAAPVAEAGSDVGQETTIDDKIKEAQRLLAMVLHNLKTSNLLEVIELEDVAGIVLQMTRSICEADGAAAAKSTGSIKAESPKGADVDLNLDDVFGLKK